MSDKSKIKHTSPDELYAQNSKKVSNYQAKINKAEDYDEAHKLAAEAWTVFEDNQAAIDRVLKTAQKQLKKIDPDGAPTLAKLTSNTRPRTPGDNLAKQRFVDIVSKNYVIMTNSKGSGVTFIDKNTGHEMNANAFDTKFARFLSDDESASEIARGLRKESIMNEGEFIDVLPRVDDVVKHGALKSGLIESKGRMILNTYRNPEFKKIEGDFKTDAVSILEAVAKEVFEDCEWLFDYFAAKALDHARLPKYGIIISGPMGAGKNLVVELLAAALGLPGENHHPLNLEQLNNKFNGGLFQTPMAIISEADTSAGDSLANRKAFKNIKTWLTEYQVSIERKGKETSSFPNCLAAVVLTNFEQAATIGNEDRRWYVMETRLKTFDDAEKWSNEKKELLSKAHDLNLKLKSEAGRAEAEEIFTMLARRDLTKFLAAHRPPHTEAKTRIQKEGVTMNAKIVEEAIDAVGGVFPDIVEGELINVGRLNRSVARLKHLGQVSGYPQNGTLLARAFVELGYQKHRRMGDTKIGGVLVKDVVYVKKGAAVDENKDEEIAAEVKQGNEIENKVIEEWSEAKLVKGTLNHLF